MYRKVYKTFLQIQKAIAFFSVCCTCHGLVSNKRLFSSYYTATIPAEAPVFLCEHVTTSYLAKYTNYNLMRKGVNLLNQKANNSLIVLHTMMFPLSSPWKYYERRYYSSPIGWRWSATPCSRIPSTGTCAPIREYSKSPVMEHRYEGGVNVKTTFFTSVVLEVPWRHVLRKHVNKLHWTFEINIY